MLAGAGMWSKTGKLKLDTNDLVFDNYKDKDTYVALSGSISVNSGNHPWDGSLPAQYKNVTGLTFATIGAGDLNIRARPKLDISGLNRDPANMQVVTNKTSWSFSIPSLNLAKVADDIKNAGNFINMLTAQVPQSVKEKGEQAVRQYQTLLLRGATEDEARALIATPEFQQALRTREIYVRATTQPGYLGPEPAGLLKLILSGENAYWDASRGVYVIETNCGSNTGPTPCQQLVSAGVLKASYTADDVKAYYKAATDALAAAAANPSPKTLQDATLAIECLVQYAIERGDSSIITSVKNQVGSYRFISQLIQTGVDPYRIDVTVRIIDAARSGDLTTLAAIKSELAQAIQANAARGTLSLIWQAVGQIQSDLQAGRGFNPSQSIANTSGGPSNPLGAWIQAITLTSERIPTTWEKLPGVVGSLGVLVGGVMIAVPATETALACAANPICRMEATAALGEALAGTTPGTLLPAGTIMATKAMVDAVENTASRISLATEASAMGMAIENAKLALKNSVGTVFSFAER